MYHQYLSSLLCVLHVQILHWFWSMVASSLFFWFVKRGDILTSSLFWWQSLIVTPELVEGYTIWHNPYHGGHRESWCLVQSFQLLDPKDCDIIILMACVIRLQCEHDHMSPDFPVGLPWDIFVFVPDNSTWRSQLIFTRWKNKSLLLFDVSPPRKKSLGIGI